MNKDKISELLEKAILFSKSTKPQKLKKAPLRLLFSKIIEKTNKPLKINAKTFWHETMSVVIPEKVSMSIYRYGYFEEGLTKMILQYLKPGMTFLDIGAHFGYFTLLGSYLVGKSGQVHSFEPTPSTFKVLEDNVSRKANVFLNNLAVFSEKKGIFINDYGVLYSAFNSIYGARLPNNVIQKLHVKIHNIEAIPIDEYTSKKGIRPNFIKIDAESAESEILIGMESTIKKYHPMISIEVGDFEVEGVPASNALISYLENKGYKPYEFRDGKILQHTPKNNRYRYDNILFLPN